MAFNIWRGDAMAVPQIESWVITDAEIGDEFVVAIGKKRAEYILTQDDVDEAEGTQTTSSVAMRGIYAAVVALQDSIAEFEPFTLELVSDEDNADEIVSITVTGDEDGKPFEAVLSAGDAGALEVDVSTLVQGNAAANEKQSVTLPGPPGGGTFTLTFSGQTSAAIAYNATNYTVRDALCDLSNILGTDEQQTLTSTASGGTFDLTFEGQTAAGIAFNVSAATLKTTLEALSNIAVNDVTTSGGPLNTTPIVITFRQALGRSNRTQVSIDNTNATGGTVVPSTNVAGVAADVSVTGSAGGPWVVEFVSALAGTNVALMTGNGGSLTGAASVTVQTVTDGTSSTSEVQEWTFEWDTASGTVLFSVTADEYFLDSMPLQGGQQAFNEAQLTGYLSGQIGSNFTITTQSSTSSVWVVQVEFTGLYAATDMSEPTIEAVPGAGDGNGSVETITEGSASGVAEVQRVTINNGPTAGTFTLSFEGQTTGAIAFDAAAGTVETALEALSNITAVAVTGNAGGPYTVTFSNPSGDVGEMTGSGASLTGSRVDIATTQSSSAAVNEVQLVTVDPTAEGGTFTLSWNPGGGAETTGAIAYNASAATVQTALEGLATPAPGDFSVTGDDGGPFLVTFTGTYAATNVAEMTGSGASLTGSGTQDFASTPIQDAESPNHFYLAGNWTLGLPADNQDLVWRDSDVPCLYDINHPEITPASCHFYASYTAPVGLKPHNGDYYENLDTKLTLGTNGDGSSDTLYIHVGEGEGNGSPFINLDTGTKKTTLVNHHTGTPEDGATPALLWIGSHAENRVEAYRGSLGIAYFPGETASVATLCIAHRGNVETDVRVVVGPGCTPVAIEKTGGALSLDTASGTSVTLFKNIAGDVNITGAGNIREYIQRGGLVISSTSGLLGEWGAITDASQADPCVIESEDHGLATGDKVRIAGIVGMTELNQTEATVEVVDVDNFKLIGVDSTGYTAYSSGGFWGRVGSIEVANEAILQFGHSLADRSVAIAIDVYGKDAKVENDMRHVTTLTYLTGEFAVYYHNAGPVAGLPQDGIVVFRAA